MDVRRTWALALVVPLFLAGCSEDEPEPKMPDPTPTSSEPSPSPTESETAEAESAEEFIRRWQAVVLAAQNAGDTAEYRPLSKKCQSCLEFADQVDRIYSDGGSIRLEGLDVLRVAPDKEDASRFTLIRRLGTTRVLDADGEVQQELSGGREELSIFLEDRGSSWRVTNVLRVQT